MLAKRLLQKAAHHHHHYEQPEFLQGNLKTDFDPQIIGHYGTPSTASILAIDPIQQLIAIGTLDGRIKVIGGCNIECLFISQKELPYKYLEFLENQGFLVGITNDNEIQVWNLESRCIESCLKWESNVTAFCVIFGSPFMFILNEHGLISVLKYVSEERKLICMPYHMSTKFIAEKAGFSFIDEPVVGILPQPCSFGNRIVIAYQNGLIILWDIAKAQVVCVRGDKDLEVKVQASDFPIKSDADLSEDAVQKLDEKEISAICWASSCGHILAVGYIDGDILLWNMPINSSSRSHYARKSSKDIVKLQLSSVDKRFPIITLRWAVSNISQDKDDGQLFIYGGIEIGSEEVVTVVSLQWSPGTETLRHARRVDLSLMGSFSDMILLSSLGMMGLNNTSGLFLLSSLGKLQFYDDKTLSALASQPERKPSIPAIEFPMVVPTSEPQITAAKLTCFTPGLNPLELALTQSNMSSEGSINWPLNGGIPTFVPSAEIKRIKRIYVTGHQDGSVRIYDASCNVLCLLSVLGSEVYGIKLAGSNAPISVMNFCAMTLTLAVGNDHGLVCIYSLKSDPDRRKICVIRDSKHEVHEVPQGNGSQCAAIFLLVSSCILSLQFSESGAKLAVGYETSHVAVLDVSSLSVIFIVDPVSESGHPVISMIWKTIGNFCGLAKGQKHSALERPEHPTEELIFILTRDGIFNVIDGSTGDRVSSQPMCLKKELKAISLHVLAFASSKGKQPKETAKEIENADDHIQEDLLRSNTPKVTENHSFPDRRLLDSLVLLCFENSLRLYTMQSAFQGQDKPIRKVELQNACCWTAILNKEDKVCGLALLYQTGTIELRSLPDLEVVAKSSLMSILRWNFRPNMDKIMSSDENGLIILVNGCELAFISLLANDDYLRAVESVPCLHDTVLAAAVDAALACSLDQKKQAGFSGLIGGIFKGFKKEKPVHMKNPKITENFECTHLDNLFSRGPATGNPSSSENKQIEELSIDDIVIDDPVPVASTSSHQHKPRGKAPRGKGPETDKERLFEGATVDTKPRLRTPEEIIAKYRKAAGDGLLEAEHARNKLLERQEKLERLTKRTEDLQDGAENFASMANELVKTMEARKWWQI